MAAVDDESKTKAELIAELEASRAHIAELNRREADPAQVLHRLPDILAPLMGTDGRPARSHPDDHEFPDQLIRVCRFIVLAELLRGITHEINQPLAAITNYASAVSYGLKADTVDRDRLLGVLEKIGEQAARAAQVVQRMRAFALDDTGGRRRADLNEIVHQAMVLVGPELRRRAIALRLETAEQPLVVQADRLQISQVVVHLVRNAIDATAEAPAERLVRVTTEASGLDVAVVTVQDNGVGLPAELSEKIFDPCFTTKTSGLGLGLFISSAIIANHRGCMGMTPNPDSGTTFRFSLPLAGDNGHDR